MFSFLPKAWLGVCPALLLVPLFGACAPRDVEVVADALPGRYPNLLTIADEELQFALIAPAGRIDPRSIAWSAVARSGTGDVEVPALAPAERRDVDGDGIDDIVAMFSVAELCAAGLLGAGSSRLRVDARVLGETLLTGSDRVLSPGAPLARLPLPAGRYPVGTTRHYLLDAARDRLHLEGRPLYIRLWYPAASSSAQPASYFLVPETAQLIATGLGLSAELFDSVHASSVRDARPAALGPRPTLLLSTGLGNPLDVYSALGEDLASHGYLVVGVGHPDGGSGQIAYPDGSSGQDDISAALDDLQTIEDPAEFFPQVDQLLSGISFEWARDLSFVLDWIEDADRGALPRPLGSVLGLADLGRVGALGHSLGGSAALWADLLSERIRASANLDGTMFGAPLEQGPDSSVLILESDDYGPLQEQADGASFLAHSRNTTYSARVAGARHSQLSDVELLLPELPQLADALGGPAESPLDPARVLDIELAYVRAFFGQALSAQPSALLKGPSQEFPEVSLEVFDAALP